MNANRRPPDDPIEWLSRAQSNLIQARHYRGRDLRSLGSEATPVFPHLPKLSRATIDAGGDAIVAKVTVDLNLRQLARAIAALSEEQRQELWSLLATIEEERDPAAIEALRESEADVEAGRLYSFEDVFGSSAR